MTAFLIVSFPRLPAFLCRAILNCDSQIVGAMGSLHGHRTKAQDNLVAAGIILYVRYPPPSSSVYRG